MVLNGTEIRFDRNTFVINTKYIQQNGINFQNCSYEFIKEVKRKGTLPEFVQEEIVNHNSCCASNE